MPSKKIVHLHNYRCDGKIIQAIMKQNGGWPYAVDGEKGASFFLHLIMFQKEYGIEPTGYFLAGSKAEDQLFALADGKHKTLQALGIWVRLLFITIFGLAIHLSQTSGKCPRLTKLKSLS